MRIGLAYIQSVGEDDADALVAERAANGAFSDVGDLARRVPLAQEGLVALVEGGACDGLGSGAAPVASQKSRAHAGKIASPKRRDLLWELGLANRPVSVPGTRGAAKQLTLSLDPTAATPDLRDLTRWEQMAADYRRTGLSVGVHPLTLLRPHLPERHFAAMTCTIRRTDRPSPMRASQSRGNGPPQRRESCSCCSRTSAAR